MYYNDIPFVLDNYVRIYRIVTKKYTSCTPLWSNFLLLSRISSDRSSSNSVFRNSICLYLIVIVCKYIFDCTTGQVFNCVTKRRYIFKMQRNTVNKSRSWRYGDVKYVQNLLETILHIKSIMWSINYQNKVCFKII